MLLVLEGWCLHFWPGYHPTNESIRFYFVESVVRDGSLSVDPALKRYGVPNEDASVVEGRHYMDKAPGVAFLALPIYATFHALGMTDALSWIWLWHLLTLLCVTIPSLLATALLYRLARDLSGRHDVSLVVSAAYAVATPAFLYSTLFFGHQLSAVCLIASFAALRPSSREPIGPARAAVSGFLLGAAIVCEYQLAVAGLGIGFLALTRARTLRGALAFLAGAFVPGVLLMGYLWAAFGHPLDVGYTHKASVDLARMHATGFFGFTLPSLDRVWGLLFSGRRGLLYCSPFLFLLPFGAIRMVRTPRWHAAGWTVLWIGIVHVVLMTGYDAWEGGHCQGPRFLVPVIPFLVLPLAALWHPGRGESIMRFLRGSPFAALVAVGAVLQSVVYLTFPYHPGELAAPYYENSLPLLLQGCTAPSVLGLSPAVTVAGYCLLFVLGIVWVLASAQLLNRRNIGRLGLGLLLAAVVVSMHIMVAPAPDNPEALRWLREARDLMMCR